MRSGVLEIRKGIRNFMNDKIQACKDVLSSAHNRLISGLILLGLGIGLIASAFIRVSA